MKTAWKHITVLILLSIIARAQAAPIYYTPEMAAKLGPDAAKRIEEIASTLEDKPKGFGVHIDQRDFWQPLADSAAGKAIVQNAEALVKEPMEELTDELYLIFSRTGDRRTAERVIFGREARFVTLCLAECVENKGRFLKPLEEVLDSTVSYRSWLYPAHDRKLDNFNNKQVYIDLKSARDGHNFALCLYMLKGKLNEQLAKKTAARIHERVLRPYAADLLEDTNRNYWRTSTNNWNSVCHAGVVGAAAAMLDDKLDRAFFIERAMHYVDSYFLDGFTPDGYCSEGLSYWNYGFGQYIVLSEIIYTATNGRVDPFTNTKGLPAAVFPMNIEIVNGIYPSIADCPLGIRPDGTMMGYVNARLNLNDQRWPLDKLNPPRGSLFEFLLFSSIDLNRPAIETSMKSDSKQPRSFFDSAGILVCRPRENERQFAAVLKGGNNNEHHNHNDLGQFIVIIDGQQVITDPGGVVYTADTFGKNRYKDKKIASYGHCVPLAGGKEQAPGKSSQAKILSHKFTSIADMLEMDLTSAYPDSGLKSLVRKFMYVRGASPYLEVTDSFEFADAASFETAIITYGTFKKTGPNMFEITHGDKTAVAEVKMTSRDIKIADEVIESTSASPRRIAVGFAQPTKKGRISIKIWPK